MSSGISRGCAGCGGPNETVYSHSVKAIDVILLTVLVLIFGLSSFTPPADPWAKAWAWGSTFFTIVALLMTAFTYRPKPTQNWQSTVLHVCLFANAVLWSLNSRTAAESCSASAIPWDCQGALKYLLYSIMVASCVLQYLFWHLEFDPQASSAGSGQLPCLGSRRSNNNSQGTSGGGGGNNGYQDNFDNQNGFDKGYELGREYTRRSKRSRRRRLADVEAFPSSDDEHGLARSPSAGYKSLGRRNSRSSRRWSSDSLDQL